MSNENDIIAHFSLQQNTSNLFLCLIFKMVFETTRVPAEAYKYVHFNLFFYCKRKKSSIALSRYVESKIFCSTPNS